MNSNKKNETEEIMKKTKIMKNLKQHLSHAAIAAMLVAAASCQNGEILIDTEINDFEYV